MQIVGPNWIYSIRAIGDGAPEHTLHYPLMFLESLKVWTYSGLFSAVLQAPTKKQVLWYMPDKHC